VADVLFIAGRIAEARARYEEILKGVPKQHDATAGLGRVRAAQGKLAEAIGLYERAVAIGPDAHMLAALGDLYAKIGDTERARATYDRLERTVSGQPEHARSLAAFYADYDRQVPRALEIARDELAHRKDVYGYDTLAWALLKNGRGAEAADAIAEALKLGTKDAKLHYHAGMIALRLGDRAKARDELRRALAINPHFSLRDADEARRALAPLDDGPASGSR
jgi:tetratricopeptide (TPR) repeat protein